MTSIIHDEEKPLNTRLIEWTACSNKLNFVNMARTKENKL